MKWISVNDKLPDTSDDVLVTDGSSVSLGDYNIKRTRYYTPENAWAIIGTNYWHPTHWMPLPEPPKIENEP